MTSLPALSIKFRTIVFSIAALGFAWGMVAFHLSPRREDPEFTIRMCVVTAAWPGVSAEKMEELVTEPLERRVEEIDGVKKTMSTTTAGRTIIKVEFVDSVDDVEQACDKVRSQIAGVALPAEVGTPYVNSNFSDTSAMLLAVYQVPGEKGSRTYTMRELEKVCEDIRDELAQVESVATVNIMSAQPEVIYVEPSSGTWSQTAVSIDSIREKLNARNVLVPGGSIDTGSEQFHVSVEGDFDAVDEIKKTTVADANGMPVTLDRLGVKVSRGYVDPPTILTYISNDVVSCKRCVIVNFTMRKQRNIVKLGDEVRTLIKRWKKTILPPDVAVAVVSDQPRVVEENISVFIDNLIQAIIVLILVAWLLIGKRVALIMGISIPIIVMVSFGVVRLFNVQLEIMTIASLIISLGMLVDCSIEICDNVHRLQEEGVPRFKAAVEGARQVLFPILMGTLTTVFAFLPMLSVSGNAGEYIRSIPVVVSTTLMVSWGVAITFTVALTWLFLKPGTDKVPPMTWLYRKLIGAAGSEEETFPLYKRFLAWSMNHRLTALFFILSFFVGAVALLATGFISTDYIPEAGGRRFLVDVWLPEGSSIRKTAAVTRNVEKIILEQARVEDAEGGAGESSLLDSMVSFIGESAPRFKLSVMLEFPKTNFAQILINAKSIQGAKSLASRLSKAFQDQVTEARTAVRKIGMGPTTKYPVMINLRGEDYTVLKQYAKEVEDALRSIPGTLDVHDSWGNLACQIDIEPDEEVCAAAGITRVSAANSLSAFLSGYYLTSYREGDHLVPVYFRLPPNERSGVENLKEFYIEGKHGKIPLESVAKVEMSYQPARVERERQKRNMEIFAQVAEGYLPDPIINQVLPELKRIQRRMPAGYAIDVGGSYEKSKEGSAKIGAAMLIALILIMLSLLVYFNSILKTIAVVMTLPLAFTGALLGLLIMNQPLGFFAQLGLLSLFGIVVNGAIVLFDFIGMLVQEKGMNRQESGEKRYEGLDRSDFIDCVVEASALRVRPIVLTTLTTAGGLLPLATGGGPLFEPMAVVLIFGLLYSTVLTLVAAPIVYTLFVEKLGMRVYRAQCVDD